MVDTTLRPRPTFSTFLQSDNSMKDGLSYFEYQRLLRSKKVALLQEKKERSYEPGYKKPFTTLGPGNVSRKIFELRTKNAPCSQSTQNDRNVEKTSKARFSSTCQVPKLDNCGVELPQEGNKVTDQSERVPRIKTRVRMIKSATARDHPLSSPCHMIHSLHERPKTVGGVRDLSGVANQEKGELP